MDGVETAVAGKLDSTIASSTYVAVTGGQTIAGLKDFTTAPTVNGSAIGGGGGVPQVGGLDGTGATDMKTLIQAALTAATPGATVRLPGTNKTYLLASGLSIPSRVTLDLGGAILKVKNAATPVNAVTFSGVTGSRLTNGRLQGNVTTPQSAVGFDAATDCVVDHCSFDSNFQIVVIGGGAGGAGGACVNCGVTDCVIEGGPSEGIEFVDCTNCYADRNRITGITTSGACGIVFMTKTAGYNVDCRASDNYLNGCDIGIGSFGGARMAIRNNVIGNAQKHGISANVGYTGALTSSDGVCTGNTVNAANLASGGSNGINIVGSGWLVNGNTIINTACTGGGGGAGISIASGDYNMVRGNKCSLNGSQGIVVASTVGVGTSVTNNVCLDNSVLGIGSADNILIQAVSTVVAGNTCNDTRGTKRIRYGLNLSAAATGSVVNGNSTPDSGAVTRGFMDFSGGTEVGNNGVLTQYRPTPTAQPPDGVTGNFTVAAGAGLNGGTATRANGTDICGQVNVNPAAGSAAGHMFTITFGKALAAAPKVFVMPMGANGAAARIYVYWDASTTQFKVYAQTAPATGAEAYMFWVVT